jgi:hypothetical protein
LLGILPDNHFFVSIPFKQDILVSLRKYPKFIGEVS